MARASTSRIAIVRIPLLGLSLATMLLGVWAGLLRLGWDLPREALDPALLHGHLMLFGFLAPVISLERAVALRRGWGFAAPMGFVAGSALIVAGEPHLASAALLLGVAVLISLFVVILRLQPNVPNTVLALGAGCLAVSVLAWMAALPLVRVAPLWTGFLVLTIVGERLELAHMGRLTHRGRRTFELLTAALLAALALLTVSDAELAVDGAVRACGAVFVGYAVWLSRFDIARRTVRRPGLPRFIALALLSGYVWLGLGGIAWLAWGAELAGPLRDAQLHAIFLGFVFSMIFGHAPVIFPGVLGVAIPFRRSFYVHLVVLHVGLAVRTFGDLAGAGSLARWGGLVSALGIVLFLLATVSSGLLSALERRCAARRLSAP